MSAIKFLILSHNCSTSTLLGISNGHMISSLGRITLCSPIVLKYFFNINLVAPLIGRVRGMENNRCSFWQASVYLQTKQFVNFPRKTVHVLDLQKEKKSKERVMKEKKSYLSYWPSLEDSLTQSMGSKAASQITPNHMVSLLSRMDLSPY